MTIFFFVVAYSLGGGLWLAFRGCAARYEDRRKFSFLVLELLTGVLSIATLSALYIAIEQALFIDIPGPPVLASLGILATALFIGAMVVEIKNPPQNYTVRKRNIKYGLQSLSGGVLILLILCGFYLLTYRMVQSQGNHFLQVFLTLLMAVFWLCSSNMVWKGGRYIAWAVKNSGDLKVGSKAMKNLRRSARR